MSLIIGFQTLDPIRSIIAEKVEANIINGKPLHLSQGTLKKMAEEDARDPTMGTNQEGASFMLVLLENEGPCSLHSFQCLEWGFASRTGIIVLSLLPAMNGAPVVFVPHCLIFFAFCKPPIKLNQVF
jgi:hypothetical protein